MAGQKSKTATRKSAPRPSPSAHAKPGRAIDLRKRAARDVVLPATERIERSLDEGTTKSLQSFRTSINWS